MQSAGCFILNAYEGFSMASAQYTNSQQSAPNLLGEQLFDSYVHRVRKRKTCESYDVCLGSKAQTTHGISEGDTLSVIILQDHIALLPEDSPIEDQLVSDSVLNRSKPRSARRVGNWSVNCNLTSVGASYHSLDQVSHIVVSIHEYGILLKPIRILGVK